MDERGKIIDASSSYVGRNKELDLEGLWRDSWMKGGIPDLTPGGDTNKLIKTDSEPFPKMIHPASSCFMCLLGGPRP